METSTAALRTQLHGMWASAAPSWGEHADYADTRGAAVTAGMLELSAPRPGERVLELACGAGGVGIAAAELVGPAGEVALSDVAPEMTTIAGARAAALGLGNVRTLTLDLDDLDQPDQAYDVVLCREGLMFALDPAHALAEIRRVLRPGGRVALAVWGPRARNPWLGLVFDAVSAQLGAPVPPPGIPGPFALDDPERLARLLAGAGLAGVAVTEVPTPLRDASFDAWWTRTSALAGPLAKRLAALPEPALRELRARLEAAAAPTRPRPGSTSQGSACSPPDAARSQTTTGSRSRGDHEQVVTGTSLWSTLPLQGGGGMDGNDPFSRELRSARERIAELQRRSTVDSRPGGGLLPEALAELDGAIEELSVTGQELHEQTVELTATRIALESERERYQALFEFAPVAYLVTDPVARILEANRAAAALLDVDQRFLVGKPLAAYVATGDRWEFRSTVNLLRRADANLVADLPVQFRRRGGGVIGTAAVTVQPVRNREGALQTLRWLLRDLAPSEPKRLVAQGELAVERDDVRKRHLEALAELDPAADLDGTVQVLLDAGVRLLDVDGVGLMLADAQGRLCAAGGSDEASLAFLRAQEHLVKGPCLHAFLLERSIQSGQMGGDPRWPQLREAAAVNGIGAVLATPIALYGGPIGACMLFSSSGIWADGEVLAAEAYASVLAASLDLAGEAQRTTVLSHRLQETLQRHEVVEQAKGALMARHGIGASEASTRLRNLARHSGRPLAEVARSLLRRLGVDP